MYARWTEASLRSYTYLIFAFHRKAKPAANPFGRVEQAKHVYLQVIMQELRTQASLSRTKPSWLRAVENNFCSIAV
eukprot:m.17105 g.17105  ORF g.17105 m.17105 type:complete len:76 (-) comp10649_c0_seq1:428-655(-)